MAGEILPPRKGLPMVDADALITAVATAFSIAEEVLRGKCRRKRSVQARCMASWLLRHRLPRSGIERSYPAIGKLLGGTDHGTVIYRVAKAEQFAERDPAYAARLRDLAWLDPIAADALPVTRLSAEELRSIDHHTKAAIAEAGRSAHRRAVQDAVASSRSKRGPVMEDDRDARNRASASILLLAAIERVRMAA